MGFNERVIIMELHNTIHLMDSSNFEDRFKAEWYQLKIRTEKLEIMLEKYKANTLAFTPKCTYEMLYEQLVCMKHYLCVLERRAKVENIPLEDL